MAGKELKTRTRGKKRSKGQQIENSNRSMVDINLTVPENYHLKQLKR